MGKMTSDNEDAMTSVCLQQSIHGHFVRGPSVTSRGLSVYLEPVLLSPVCMCGVRDTEY